MRQFIPLLLASFLISISLNAQTESNTQESKKEKKSGFKLLERKDTTEIPKNLYVWGVVLEKGYPLGNADVAILKNGVKIDIVKSDPKGYFDVYLDFGFSFLLEFGKPGYVTKRLEIDALDVPLDDRNNGFETGDFKVEIFKKVPDVDVSLYKQPVGRIYYNTNMMQFVYDRKYISKFKKKSAPVDELIAEKLIMVEEDLAAVKREYDFLIRDADIEFESTDYTLAKDYYQEALRLRPNEEYPTKMLTKIELILNSSSLALKDKINMYKAKADSSFDLVDYDNAKIGYEAVLKIDDGNLYAKKRLAESKDMITKQLAALELKDQEEKEIDISNIEIKPSFQKKSAELVTKYPQGVTKKEYKEGSKVISLIIVISDDKGVEYKKVKHDWGGEYYFRNGESVPKFEYNKEINN